MDDIVCFSPIDGREVARRKPASDAAIEKALDAAHCAQIEWAKTPVAARVAAVLKFMDAMLALNQEIVPELALQMGRPVRYAGEFRDKPGVFELAPGAAKRIGMRITLA